MTRTGEGKKKYRVIGKSFDIYGGPHPTHERQKMHEEGGP